MAIYYFARAHVNCTIMAMLYTLSIGNPLENTMVVFKMIYVIVFLARDILPFVMYCVNGKPRSSLFIVYRLYDINLYIIVKATALGLADPATHDIGAICQV